MKLQVLPCGSSGKRKKDWPRIIQSTYVKAFLADQSFEDSAF
jgi:hypothetical protein